MKKVLLCIATVSALLAAAPAMASDDRDLGGFKYGPYGQRMGGPFWQLPWRAHRYNYGFAFAPGYHRYWHHERDRR